MHKNYIETLAYHYKRLMDLEHCFKNKILNAFYTVHGENCFKVLSPYFLRVENKRKNDYRNKFLNLSNAKITGYEKLEKALEYTFFSDLIQLLDEPVFFKDKAGKTFYTCKINPKTFRAHKKPLKNFRNAIAHYNFKDFRKNRKIYIDAFIYFENIIGCRGFDLINYDSLPKNYNKKPDIKEILNLIYSQNTNIFKDDRVLIEIFDQIAFLYGYTYDSLPRRWTIIRQKYQIEKDFKNLLVNTI